MTGPFILAKNVKTTAVLQQTLGTFKNQRPKGGVSSPQERMLLFVEHQVPALLLLWRLGQIVLL